MYRRELQSHNKRDPDVSGSRKLPYNNSLELTPEVPTDSSDLGMNN